VVAGHSPEVLLHADLTDLEAAGTAPTETTVTPAADAILHHLQFLFLKLQSAGTQPKQPLKNIEIIAHEIPSLRIGQELFQKTVDRRPVIFAVREPFP
jgi:hypothetical protein